MKGRHGSFIKGAAHLAEITVATCSRRCGLTQHALRKAGNQGTTVALTYHHIGPKEATTPLTRALSQVGMSITPEVFARQMQLIAAHFTVVSLKDFLSARSGASTLPRNAILLTFDDGFRDTVNYALPILASHGFHGMFSLVGCHLARESLAPLFKLDHRMGGRTAAGGAPDGEFRRMRQAVLYGGKEARDVAEQLGISRAEEREAVENLFIGPEDAAAMAQSGHEIAAHGWEHLMCSKLSEDDLSQDVRRTMKIIEQATGIRPEAFVYPYGMSGSFTQQTGRVLSSEGLRCAFTAVEGVNEKTTPMFALKRVQCDPVSDDVLLLRMTGVRGRIKALLGRR